MYLVTQGLGGSIQDIPYWAEVPMETIFKIVELKNQQMQPKDPQKEAQKVYEADEYTEEVWLKQFTKGGKPQ